ncbi:hypothetical protein GOV13_04390 [Candidatus Pacearchaeota archaeon]|nr:hypothetical protein [Candidatus Pacearchaeota archaeon]
MKGIEQPGETTKLVETNYKIKELSLDISFSDLKEIIGVGPSYGINEDENAYLWETGKSRLKSGLLSMYTQKDDSSISFPYPKERGLIALVSDRFYLGSFNKLNLEDYSDRFFIGKVKNPKELILKDNQTGEVLEETKKYFHEGALIEFRYDDFVDIVSTDKDERLSINREIISQIESHLVLSMLELCKIYNGKFKFDVTEEYQKKIVSYSEKKFSVAEKDSLDKRILKDHWSIVLKGG